MKERRQETLEAKRTDKSEEGRCVQEKVEKKEGRKTGRKETVEEEGAVKARD